VFVLNGIHIGRSATIIVLVYGLSASIVAMDIRMYTRTHTQTRASDLTIFFAVDGDISLFFYFFCAFANVLSCSDIYSKWPPIQM
jgi:hypothetical protein